MTIGERPMDIETCLNRLRDLALAVAEDIEDEAIAQTLRDDINRDYDRIESRISYTYAMDNAVMSDDYLDSVQPPRLDLAAGALAVAMGTTTDAEIKPWLQTALDFINGDYEPLEDDAVEIGS